MDVSGFMEKYMEKHKEVKSWKYYDTVEEIQLYDKEGKFITEISTDELEDEVNNWKWYVVADFRKGDLIKWARDGDLLTPELEKKIRDMSEKETQDLVDRMAEAVYSTLYWYMIDEAIEDMMYELEDEVRE